MRGKRFALQKGEDGDTRLVRSKKKAIQEEKDGEGKGMYAQVYLSTRPTDGEKIGDDTGRGRGNRYKRIYGEGKGGEVRRREQRTRGS
jgi:hypothetical protein